MQAALMLCPFIKADGSRFMERVRKTYGDKSMPRMWTLMHCVSTPADPRGGYRVANPSAFFYGLGEENGHDERCRTIHYRRIDVVFMPDFVGPLEGDYITIGDTRFVAFYCEDDAAIERLRARFKR